MARYIDIDKAMPFIDEMGKKYCMTPCNILTCKEILAKVPTADVQEVRHAKFELIDSGKGICSNCHRLDSIDNLAKYCRYCGAKIDKEAEAKWNKRIYEEE